MLVFVHVRPPTRGDRQAPDRVLSEELEMSSFDRALAGEVLKFDLEAERSLAIETGGFERTGRTARTLVKEGGLNVVMIVLGAGGELAEHRAPGPITIRPVDGRISFEVDGTTHDVGVGQLLAVDAGVAHAVRSKDGATFILTVVDGRSTG